MSSDEVMKDLTEHGVDAIKVKVEPGMNATLDGGTARLVAASMGIDVYGDPEMRKFFGLGDDPCN